MLKLLRVMVLLAFAGLVAVIPALAQSQSWSCYGPYGGRILAIAISPCFPADNTIFASAGSAGLFRTADGGDVWGAVSGLPADLTISSVAISPGFDYDHTLFASTTQGGIFKSWDKGETWESWSAGLSTLSVAQVAVSPAYDVDQSLVAATSRGLHLSTSAGKLWLPVGPTVASMSVAISPPMSEAFTAYGGTVVGLYVSTDSGRTWEASSLTGVPVVAVALSPDFPSDQRILVGTLAGAYLSTDGGTTWEGPWLPEQGVHHTLFSPNYGNDHVVFLGAEDGVYVSSDDGETWDFDGQIGDTVHALAGSPDYATRPALYAGTDHGGVHLSTDGAATWTARNNGIAGLLIDSVAASPDFVGDRTVFAGGPSGVWRSTDDTLSWQMTSLDYAEATAIQCSRSYSATGTVYAATNGGLFVSQNGGQSWAPTAGSPDVLGILDLALGPGDEIWLGTAEGGVYHSTDEGASWEERSDGLGSLHVTAIEWLDAGDDGAHLVAGTWGAGIFVSDDGGLSWVDPTAGPATPHIRDLAAAMGFRGRIWTFAGTTAGLFRSGDRGNAWDFTGFLGQDISGVALHPNYAVRPNCYLGGRDDGVFRSLNGGLTWDSLNDGLGTLHVRRIAVATDVTYPVLFAATEGGVWRYGGPPQPSGPTPTPSPTPVTSAVSLPLLFK